MKKKWWLVLLSRDEARLCAAAPDLYKALEAFGSTEHGCPFCGHEDRYDDCSGHDSFVAARAALAKARGET